MFGVLPDWGLYGLRHFGCPGTCSFWFHHICAGLRFSCRVLVWCYLPRTCCIVDVCSQKITMARAKRARLDGSNPEPVMEGGRDGDEMWTGTGETSSVRLLRTCVGINLAFDSTILQSTRLMVYICMIHRRHISDQWLNTCFRKHFICGFPVMQ